MTKKLLNALFYVFFLFIGYFIWKFQVEKSFNLLTIYTLTVGFSFICFLFNIEIKKALPILFLSGLFMMYCFELKDGVVQYHYRQFFILLGIYAALLLTLIPRYPLLYKKIAAVVWMIMIAGIYLLKGNEISTYRYIPYVIGSFFMFRTVSYLHELKFIKKEASVMDNINYFLLVPNFSLPLFPIVDYKSFITSYEGVNTNTLKRSSLFVCRGFFQLILYRIIYHDIIFPISEIHTASDVFIYVLSNFLTILRVIGAFHIAIGLVILTGYNIPDLFNNIFFSTGFSNLWRRTNMYWKNFIIKIFYYPIYFKIKRIGIYSALFIATFICFFITWFLHTYQWFWIKSSFPIELKDAIFWGSFGLLVAINTLLQQKDLDRGTAKKLIPAYDFIQQAFYGLIVLVVMSVLWSIWTSDSLYNWWSVITLARNISLYDMAKCLYIAIFYLCIASSYHYYQKHKEKKLLFIKKNMTIISYVGFIAFIGGIFLSMVIARQLNNMYFGLRIIPIVSERLNKADMMNIDNGYYTNLISTNNYCSQVWTNDYDINKNPTQYINMHATRPTYDILLAENIPNTVLKFKDNMTYSINGDGQHDKTYAKVKPDSCYRIILLGGSYECGNGVSDGEDFLSKVEASLNEHYVARVNGEVKHIELINFSVNGYMLMQRYYQYKDKARSWHPDAVFLFLHTDYRQRITNYVSRLVYGENKVNDPYLKDLIAKKQITKHDDNAALLKKLGGDADSINTYAIHGISSMTHQDKTRLIAVFLPAVKDIVMARDTNFNNYVCQRFDMKLLSLADVFYSQKNKDLSLSDVDFHPNKKANDLIAKKLLDNIILHQDYLNIQFTKK
jgi:hypothetical protein